MKNSFGCLRIVKQFTQPVATDSNVLTTLPPVREIVTKRGHELVLAAQGGDGSYIRLCIPTIANPQQILEIPTRSCTLDSPFPIKMDSMNSFEFDDTGTDVVVQVLDASDLDFFHERQS